MHQGSEQQMPSFDLPSKILCKVVNVHLRVSCDISMHSCYIIFLLSYQSFIWEFVVLNYDYCLAVQAEPETDEVYAQITLLPEADVSTLSFFQ